MMIRREGDELMQAERRDGRTDMARLTVAFHNFANAYKISYILTCLKLNAVCVNV